MPKYHFILAPIFVIILLTIYFVGTKLESKKIPLLQPNAPKKTLTVSRATWGENCNEAIEFASDGDDRVEVNNVLVRVGQICNGRETCRFPVNTNALGDSPVNAKLNCEKKLAVEFRCNPLDVPTPVSARDDFIIVISCDPKELEKPLEKMPPKKN